MEITIEEVKDIFKHSIDETTNMNEAIERTVQHIYLKGQIDVLDKIRAEIEALPKTYPFVNHIDAYVKEDDINRIIDKCKAKESDYSDVGVLEYIKQDCKFNEVLDKIRAETTHPFVTYIIPTGTEKPLKFIFEGDDHIDKYVKEEDVRRIINKYNNKEVNE